MERSSTNDEQGIRAAIAAYRKLPGDSVAKGPSAYGAVLPASMSHYTDAAGALGILSKSEFWASHALFMNDAMELKLARPLIGEALESQLAQVADASIREPLAASFWSAYDSAERDPGIYVVCFSTAGDQLGQWRGYGFQGGGYSLKYDGRRLAELASSRDDLELVEVLYDKSRQMAAVSAVAHAICVGVVEFLAENPEIPREKAIQSSGFMGAQFAQGLAYRMKDETFAEEREWRLIYRRYAGDADVIPREFRISRQRLLPFTRIRTSQPDDRSLAPSEVVVGPTAHPELAALSMRYLLDDAGMSDVPLTTSTITLRA